METQEEFRLIISIEVAVGKNNELGHGDD